MTRSALQTALDTARRAEERCTKLSDALLAVRDRIVDPVHGGIDDTFWMSPTETVVDFIDHALSREPPRIIRTYTVPDDVPAMMAEVLGVAAFAVKRDRIGGAVPRGEMTMTLRMRLDFRRVDCVRSIDLLELKDR